MARTITPFLMFDGVAEQAMNLYVSLFEGAAIISTDRYESGAIRRAVFELCGRRLFCADSPIRHDFSFTPSLSLFVECASVHELDNAFARLSDDGRVLMPAGDYGFSKRFAWTDDRFGVSWQLNFSD